MTLVPGPADDAAIITISWLEMTHRDQFRPATRVPAGQPLLLTAGRPAPELSEFCYRVVGAPWLWVDRNDWTPEQWSEWVRQPGHVLTTCWVDGVLAGYFELDRVGADVQLDFFGLTTDFIGIGLGGWLLTRAVATAWDLPGAGRVWLRTCTLDGPTALANYQARGFRVFRQTTEWRRLP